MVVLGERILRLVGCDGSRDGGIVRPSKMSEILDVDNRGILGDHDCFLEASDYEALDGNNLRFYQAIYL